MKIDSAVKRALAIKGRGADFTSQLADNKRFQRRMEDAGVITRKPEFTIPLMERIACTGGN